MSSRIKILSSFILLLISSSISADPGSELSIQRITPHGENISQAQQIVIEFDQPVVPLGDMKRDSSELPITISPALNCQWRWMDTRSLVCQLNAKDRFVQATEYTVNIAPGITTEAGLGMKEAYNHSFTTELPQVTSARFTTWVTPGKPVIRVHMNMPVTKRSVEKSLSFIGEGIDVNIKATLDPDYHNKEAIDPNTQHTWLITPTEEIKPASISSLYISSGLKTNLGELKGNEERVITEFATFSDFQFLGIRCYSKSASKEVTLTSDNLEPICDPQSNIYLSFSSPVSFEEIKKGLVMTPALNNGRKDYDPWAGRTYYSRLARTRHHGETYEVYLPEFLQAYQEYQLSGKDIKDEFGRSLAQPFELKFMTDHRRPDLNITNPIAVLEKNVDSDVPVYVTNIDSMNIKYSATTVNGQQASAEKEIIFPEIVDIAFARPLPYRELLGHQSGVISGYVEQYPNPKKYNPSKVFAQVTPYQVQAKIGHFSSLVWVTDMATGKPVVDAEVSIYIGSMTSPSVQNGNVLQRVNTDEHGIAKLSGLRDIDPQLDFFQQWKFDAPRLMLNIRKNDDIAVLPVVGDFSIWGRDVYPWNRQKGQYRKAWGTTAQGVYKPGDTIQYKIYVRDENNKTLTQASEQIWNLEITDPTGKKVGEENDLKLNKFGAFDSEVFIPKNAAVGWYNFVLRSQEDDSSTFNATPITVLVSDFTPAPFKVSTDLNGKVFEPGDELVISTAARLHAGGPYTNAPTSVSADLKSGYFQSTHALAKKFQFDTQQPDTPNSASVFKALETLNDNGDLETKLILEDKNIIYGTLRVESSVRDDRGKSVANMTTTKFFARDQLVGLKNTQWVYQQDKEAEVQYMVVDQQGQPVENTAVNLKVERQETKASRVKSAGNTYVTKYITDWVDAAECQGVSTSEPAPCLFTPSDPGSYRITATIKDSLEREHSSQIHAWVVGKGRVMWEQPSNNNLTIIPENDAPEIGDTVRYLVKNPYPGGKALVTIERYGIIKSWVEDFDDSTEIIEFPVEPDFMPGFYLSVTIFSERVDKPIGEGNVDLGKPTFTMGYVRVPVTDPYKRIDVDINSNAETFQPKDKVKLSFSAKPRNKDVDNNTSDAPIELAIVVIDEAVFDLNTQGQSYYDPYKGFYHLGALDISNYSLLNRLVGRQKFETKGANTGGGGGGEESVNFRSIEKYIAYWNPSITLQPGETKDISFQAPDNLTGWRVFAMAVTETDRLGLGQSSFKVNKEVELRPVMPNQVMQGDQFDAGFSVMNRTDSVKEIKVNVKATGDLAEDITVSKTVTVEPYKRETVWLPIKTKQTGEIKFSASAIIDDEVTKTSDGLAHTVPVLRRDVFETATVYGTFDDDKATTSILFPEQIHNDAGELSVTVSPTVISNVDGAFKYMRDYPYWCWEQRLSKGVMAEHFNSLKDYMPESLKWANSETLALQMLEDAANFQAPNGGMAFWIPENKHVNPYLSAYTALAFNWLASTGHTIPETVEKNLHNYLEKLLKRDVMPNYYSKGMASSVRAVALSALSAQGKVSLEDLQRYRDHVPHMSLFGKSQYLIAANRIEGAEAIATELIHMILAKSVQSAGKFQFNESSSSDYQRILATPVRTQCSILSAFTAAAKTEEGKKLVDDVPFKIVRAITQGRGKRDHWENTQENLFCMNALSEYSRVYEAQTPMMTIKASMDDKLLGESKFTSKRDADIKFSHAINEKDPGRKATVNIDKEGTGRVYYTTRMQYAPLDTVAERVHSGIEIRREYSVQRADKWVILTSPMQVKRGELIKVDLFLHLPATRNYVVVDDPVPGGLEPVNRDLATSSVMDAEAGETKPAKGSIWFERDDWLAYNYSYSSFYHKELRHDSVRFYSDYLTPGHYHLSYTAQAIATGEFSVLPSQSEEMYDPDVYGRSLPARLNISE